MPRTGDWRPGRTALLSDARPAVFRVTLRRPGSWPVTVPYRPETCCHRTPLGGAHCLNGRGLRAGVGQQTLYSPRISGAHARAHLSQVYIQSLYHLLLLCRMFTLLLLFIVVLLRDAAGGGLCSVHGAGPPAAAGPPQSAGVPLCQPFDVMTRVMESGAPRRTLPGAPY